MTIKEQFEALKLEEAPTEISYKIVYSDNHAGLDSIELYDQDGKCFAAIWSSTAVNLASAICEGYNTRRQMLEHEYNMQVSGADRLCADLNKRYLNK